METIERPDDAWLDEIEHIRHERRKELAEYQYEQADQDYAEIMWNRRELHAGKVY